MPDGDIANFALVSATSGKNKIGLYLVDLSADGVEIDSLETFDPSRSHADISFKKYTCSRAKRRCLGRHRKNF